MSSVLVVYASRYGSTKGVAERIAATLRTHGAVVELRSVDEAENRSAHDAVVFGSAVFNQRWMPEGERWVYRNLSALVARPVLAVQRGDFW